MLLNYNVKYDKSTSPDPLSFQYSFTALSGLGVRYAYLLSEVLA